jgi:hypothetical protein
MAKFQKGNKLGRSRKGIPNRVTRATKEVIAEAFQKAGGMKTFVQWAKDHPTEFYTKLYSKLIPAEMNVSGGDGPPLRMVLVEWAELPEHETPQLNGHRAG